MAKRENIQTIGAKTIRHNCIKTIWKCSHISPIWQAYPRGYCLISAHRIAFNRLIKTDGTEKDWFQTKVSERKHGIL